MDSDYNRTPEGTFAVEYPEELFLTVLSKHCSVHSALTCSDVSNEIGCSVTTAKKTLSALADSRKIRKEMLGCNWLYWIEHNAKQRN